MAISWNNQKDNKALAWKEINLIKNRKVLPWNKTTNKDSNVLDLNKESSTEISTTRNLPVIESLSPQVEKQMEEEKAELNKNTWLRQVQRFLLPKELEIRYGFTEPGFWDKIDKVEGERMLYMREQHFKDLYEQEVKETPKISEDYEEPDTFIGQVLESAKMGYISSIKGNTGYFIESLGREIGSTKMVQWGMDVGDKAIIEVLKNPELFAPEDLKPFFEGGIVDKRWWARAIGQSLPFMATTITTATIGGLMGGPVGAAGGGFLSSASLEKGGSYKKYIDEGVPLDKADTYSNFYGVIAGTIENAIGISPARIGGMLSYKGAERVIANSYKSFLFREIPKIGIQTLKTALEEGGEEVAQSITENLILKFFKTETPVLTKDLAEEFASGFAAAIPFGASNIRIPEIVKDNNENQEKIEELINSTDKAFKEQESEILEKVQKNIDFYQSTGTSHEGDIQPVNAGLLELQKLADNKEVIEKTQEQIKPLIEDDGMITLYRVGEPTDVDRFVSATYDKDFAEEFAEGVEATRDVKPTITETRVRPEDIKIFIGGAEKEVLVPSSVYRTQDPLIQEAKKYKSADEFVDNELLIRVEEKGDKVNFDKPQGLYVSIGDKHSSVNAFSKYGRGEGDIKSFVIDKNKNPKIIELDDLGLIQTPRGLSGASAGITYLKKVLPTDEFNRLMSSFGSPKEYLIEDFSKEYPNIKWNKYFDANEVLEGYAGIKARENGVDILKLIDKTDPRLSEVVILNKDVVKKQTKSQLKDIWEKANKQQPTVQETPEPLLEEAKKYKSAEEFVEAQFSKKPEYGMGHRPSYEGMPPSYNLLEGETLPRDVYTHPDFSIASGRIRSSDKAATESWNVLQKIKGKPEAEVTLYRAGAKNELNTGDWVTFSKEYAKQSLEGMEKIYSFKAKAKDVIFAGDDINEFGYYPKSQLTDIWNKAQRQTDPLIQEAKKYKSADEFARKGERDGVPLYEVKKIDNEFVLDSVGNNKLNFDFSGKNFENVELSKKQILKNIKKLEAGESLDPILIDTKGNVIDGQHRMHAYDILGYKEVPVYKAKNKKTIFDNERTRTKEIYGEQTKSQLTDIWNQAQTTFKKITSKFPENKYKLNLLDEINKAKSLPRIDSNAFDWIPPTVSYNNPYTRVMTKAWDKISNVWDSKAPLVVKQFHSKEVGNIIKERQRVYDGLTKKYEEEIVRPVTKLTKEEKEKIGNMIFKRIKIPEDYKATIKNIDFKIGQLGNAIVNIDKEMIANKQLKKEDSLLTEKTWAENLGEYARTLYVKEENGEAKITARSEVTKNGVINRSAFKKKMTDEEWGANALKFEGKTIEEIEQYSLEELKEIGEEAKENYGWTVQADYILSRTFIDLTKSYTTRLFQKEIVENQRLFTNNFKTAEKMGFIPIRDVLPKPLKIKTDDNFITVSQAKKLGPLAHGYIHEGLQDEIKTFINPQEMDSVMAIFQGPLSWWKIFKVAANPATVVRNFISGAAAQTDLAGYPVWTIKNSKRYAQAVKSYITRDSLYKELRDGGQYGSDYHSVEVSQDEMSKIVNRAEKSNNSYQEYTGELLNKLTSIISESGNKLEDSKELFNYYGHIDHIQRTYLALCAKEDGARTSQAVHFANKWELDYRFVPKFVDSLRSGLPGWLFPFLSFYTLMAPRVAETLITRPWVLVKYPLIFAALNSISMALLGVDDDEIENAKPEWLEGNNYTIILPKKDKNGDFVFLNLDYTLPFGGWKDAFMDIDQVVQMTKSPGIMSGVLGILNNYDFFTEKKIYNETDLNEEKRKKIAKYIVSSFGPGFVTHAINIYDVSKGEKSGFPIEKEKSLKVAIGKAAGISLYSGGFNEAYWKIKNIKSEISEIQWAMKLFMQDENISSEEKQEKLIEFREEIQIRKEKIRDISNNMPSQQSNNKKTEVIPFNQ
jgi:hypothetical protein